ncbi:MAG: hypothetical protein AAFR52_06855, partial [Pseudomonadota bacterium]
VREIIEALRYRAVEARYKVYIVDEVHMMSTNAFNAFLKTLEEPPEHVVFLFATTEIRKVPVTVLSRCQRFDLRRIEPAVMLRHLSGICTAEGVSVEDEALGLVTRASEGSVRDALSLLDQAIALGSGGEVIGAGAVRSMLGLADRGRVFDLFETVMAGDAAGALAELARQHAEGAEPAVVLRDLAELAHWISVIKIADARADDPTVAPEERRRGRDLASRLSMRVLSRAWQMLLKILDEVASAPQPLMAAEMGVIRLTHVAELPSPADLVARLGGASGMGPAAQPAAAAPAPAAGPGGGQGSGPGGGQDGGPGGGPGSATRGGTRGGPGGATRGEMGAPVASASAPDPAGAGAGGGARAGAPAGPSAAVAAPVTAGDRGQVPGSGQGPGPVPGPGQGPGYGVAVALPRPSTAEEPGPAGAGRPFAPPLPQAEPEAPRPADTAEGDIVAALEALQARLNAAGHLLEANELGAFVRPVRLRPGLLEFEPAPNAPGDLSGRLRAILQTMDGTRWSVVISRSPGAATLAERRQGAEAALQAEAEAHPIVAAALAAFPGARIAALRPLGQRAAPALPEPEDDNDYADLLDDDEDEED